MTCKTEGCHAPAVAKGRCARCYQAKRRGAKPRSPRAVPTGPMRYLGVEVPEATARGIERLAKGWKVSVSSVMRTALATFIVSEDHTRRAS